MAAATPDNTDGQSRRPVRSLVIDLYSSRFDVQCIRAKALFDRKGLEYNEYDVESDRANHAMMLKRTGGETSLPQIFINGRSIGGFEELSRLIDSGELDDFMVGTL